jgi:hypothetical protein
MLSTLVNLEQIAPDRSKVKENRLRVNSSAFTRTSETPVHLQSFSDWDTVETRRSSLGHALKRKVQA